MGRKLWCIKRYLELEEFYLENKKKYKSDKLYGIYELFKFSLIFSRTGVRVKMVVFEKKKTNSGKTVWYETRFSYVIKYKEIPKGKYYQFST